jgi:ParB/RepB/Spo0J family partition protein
LNRSTTQPESKLVPIVQLDACDTNGRGHSDPAAMAELTDSVREHGIIQPLIVRRVDDRYEVVCGHRRLEAARQAGMLDVPVIVLDLSEAQAAQVQLVENLQREDLAPLDEALAIERLLTLVPIEEAAAQLGKSRTYLAGRMVLTRLPQGARLALEAGTLNLSVALMIARIHDEALREKVALEVQDGRKIWDPDVDEPTHVPFSVAETRDAFARTMLHLAHATFEPEDADLRPDALPCRLCPKRSGNAPDLFGDVSDQDVCTDPICFAEKRDAGWEARKAEAEEKGYKVLPDKRAKRILLDVGQYSGRGVSQIRSDSGFIGPGDRVGRDGDSRQWLQVAKAAKVQPITLAVRDPETDKPVLLWRAEDLAELLPATEKAKLALPKAIAEAAEPKPAAEKPAGPDDWEVRREATPELDQAVVEAVKKLQPLAFLRMYVEIGVGRDRMSESLKFLGLKAKKSTKDLDAPTCQAILALDLHKDVQTDIEKALGVDSKRILAAAKKRLLEPETPPAKPAMAKKPTARKGK